MSRFPKAYKVYENAAYKFLDCIICRDPENDPCVDNCRKKLENAFNYASDILCAVEYQEKLFLETLQKNAH